MRARVLVGSVSVVAVLGIAAPAQAAKTVQFDMADIFNRDVIVNGTALNNLDETQTSVDISETSLITHGAARVLDNCTADPDGLPNNGRFAANPDHPLVDLTYDNEQDGQNARRSPSTDRYRVSVPQRRYRAVHVFATSGNGSADMRVKLRYKGASSVKELTVPDWFDSEPPDGYALIDDRDRAEPNASICHDDDAAAIWGFKVRAKKTRRLKAVKIVRPDSGDEGVLNVFGMTGLKARSRR